MTESRQQGRMSSGASAQRNGRFARGLLDPDVAVPDFVSPVGGMPAGRRYAIYRNNVVVGLMEAMQAAYPSLLALMGEAVFARTVRTFIADNPPRSAMMQRYGEDFADFVDGFEPLRGSRFLADVARLESAWLVAYHAADAAVLTGDDLTGLDPEGVMQLVLDPHPALALVASDHPLADLFAFRYAPPADGIDLTMAQNVMVTRPALSVLVTAIDPSQFAFVKALGEGARLGEAAQAALSGDAAFDLAGALALCLQKGTFRRPAIA